jgi:hypothetical protein
MADEKAQALVQRETAVTTPPPPDPGLTPVRRKRAKKPRPVAQTWEEEPQSGSKSQHSSRSNQWLSMVGGLIGLLISAALIWSVLQGTGQTGVPGARPESDNGNATGISEAELPDVTEAVANEISDAAFLKLAEPLAKAFVEAKSVEELEPLVWKPERTMQRVRAFYQNGSLPHDKLLDFHVTGVVERMGAVRVVGIRTGDFRDGGLAFREQNGAWKIDWESWVGWSEMPLSEFLQRRVTEPTLFRVLVTPVDYYNFAFRDDLKWMSCRLEFPDREEFLYGYVERDTNVYQNLRQEPQEKRVPMILELAFPANAERNNQVLVVRHHADGWVADTESPP